MKHLFFSITILFTTLGFSVLEVPELNGRVNDLGNMLSWQNEDDLTELLNRIEDSSGAQIAILTVKSTSPETIEEYSIRVAEEWQLGRAQYDDGILILLSKDDRKVRIEVGYGLEGSITDYDSKIIIETLMVPRFKEGDFHQGINDAVIGIIELMRGNPLPTPVMKTPSTIKKQASSAGTFLGVIFLILFFMVGAIISSIPLVIIGLIIYFIVKGSNGKEDGNSRYRRGFSTRNSGSSSSFNSGGSYSGGGGFSGGGGSFGGGGSAGSW